jgi:hypothetical protein
MVRIGPDTARGRMAQGMSAEQISAAFDVDAEEVARLMSS